GLGLPALLRLRAGQAKIDCENNLRVFNTALQNYFDLNGKFPSVVAEKPRHAAGMVVPILSKAGVLPESSNVRCPGRGPVVSCPLTLEQAYALSPEEFFRQAESLIPSYAYSLGYRDDQGRFFGPTVPEGELKSAFPLMADEPPLDGGLSNSNN